jgi:hypothetical protein
MFSMDPDRVETVAQFVASKFNDPIMLRTGMKWMMLGNYVDHVVR